LAAAVTDTTTFVEVLGLALPPHPAGLKPSNDLPRPVRRHAEPVGGLPDGDSRVLFD
jgi:hypothetical protein